MSSLRPQDRASLCRYTYSDNRKCLTPRAPNHPHFCYFHARQEARACATDELSHDLKYLFSGEYLSACDLSAAIARLIPAVARGDIKPRTASTLAYLAQTLVQTIHLSQREYVNAYGYPAWHQAIRTSITQNVKCGNADSDSDSPESDSSEKDVAPNSSPASSSTQSAERVPPQPNAIRTTTAPATTTPPTPPNVKDGLQSGSSAAAQPKSNPPRQPSRARRRRCTHESAATSRTSSQSSRAANNVPPQPIQNQHLQNNP